MSIYRTTNPAEFDDVDGIIVAESAPAPNISGVAANIAVMVGQFERGQDALTEVSSIGEFHELYGKSEASGNVQLKNKKFGRLRLIRVVASNAAAAEQVFASSTVDRIRFTAKQGKGAYGNKIEVRIEAGSVAGSKYTIRDTSAQAVLPQEIYDNVLIASAAEAMANSSLVSVSVLSAAAEPSAVAFTALAGGSDGTVADTDYEAAIGKAEVEGSGNVLFLDVYNATRCGYLKAHAANTQDKMVVCASDETESVADVIAAVADVRDVDGRIIYAYPWVETVINGVKTMTSPASWVASILSQTSPHIDPAYAENIKYMAGAIGLKSQLTRNQYIQLKDAGVAAFEYDGDLGGFKLKSGIVTQISNSSKVTILRRRMADYLTASISKFLKNYQNAPNTKAKRAEVKGAILAFIDRSEREGMLPSDKEVNSGKAKVVDVESLNTDASIASGMFKILYKQRLLPAMRYIVLQAEIGESVVVVEGE